MGKKIPMLHIKKVRFINTYNGAMHETTGVSGLQMQDDDNLEVQYIIDLIN
jgi:hypothetical protein